AVVAAAPAARAEPPERVTALVDGEGEAALRQGRTEALAGVLRTVLAQEGLHAAVTGDARAELVESCASLLTNERVRARRGRAVYTASVALRELRRRVLEAVGAPILGKRMVVKVAFEHAEPETG